MLNTTAGAEEARAAALHFPMEELPYIASPEEAKSAGIARAEEADAVASTATRASDAAEEAAKEASRARASALEKAAEADRFVDDWLLGGRREKAQEEKAQEAKQGAGLDEKEED